MADCCRFCIGTGTYRGAGRAEVCPHCEGTGDTVFFLSEARRPAQPAQQTLSQAEAESWGRE